MKAEFDKEYRQQRKEITEKDLSAPLPSVNLYKLSVPEEYDEAVRAISVVIGSSPTEKTFSDAARSGILRDRFEFQLEDLAKTRRSKGHFDDEKKGVLERYLGIYDCLNFGTIAEFPWKENKDRFVRILDEDVFAEVIYSRNKFSIPDSIQQKLRQMQFAVAGLSVGGNIAYLSVLSGIEKWVVADGGLLDLHDFNRAIGSKVSDIGRNQTNRWAESVLEHNPYLQIKAFNCNVGEKTKTGTIGYDDFLQGVDRVIEAVDNLQVKHELRQRADVVMCTDMGFAAKIESDKQGIPFHGRLSQESLNFISSGEADKNLQTKTAMAVEIVGLNNVPPEYLMAMQQSQKAKVSFWPQPGASSFLAASMFIASEVRRLENIEVNNETTIDLNSLLKI